MNVSVRSTTDPLEFLQSAKRWLVQDETANNTILSIANQAGTVESLLRPPFWFAYSVGPNGDRGYAVFALPDGLVLSEMPKSHCTVLVKDLLNFGVAPERIYAPGELAPIASTLISDATGGLFRLKKRWRALQRESVIDNHNFPDGYLRLATIEEIDTISQFGNQYDLENPSVVKAADYFLTRLKAGDLFLWVVDHCPEIRAILALSGRTDRVVRIAGVFTPNKYRGNGYASSSIVRATNDGLLSGYSIVTLVVDTADDVAVDMYLRLGFEPIHERLELIID